MLKGIMSLLIVLAFAGCQTMPANLSMPLTLDGNWQITITGGAGISGTQCITVSNGTVSAFDDGCIGSLLPIISANPAAISGERAVWFVAVNQLYMGEIVEQHFTIDVTAKSDGSFTGTLTSNVPSLGSGAEVTVNIIMNPV